ncbi:MAG: hypothetical protein HC881_16995 [Leptolyngbyaceae cyanobacterium SL_7_1]|nr:hypothetical protein [Leptolyngbyaceae cyanobacterium SL_7_1]
MNGACESAELAALDILEDLGLQAAASQQRARVRANRQARSQFALSGVV